MPNIAARSPVGYKLCARGTPSQLVHDSCRMRVPWCEQNAPAAPMPKRRQLTGLQNLARLWQTAPAPAGARIPTRSKSQRPTMACFRLQAGRARLTCRVATCEALKAQLQERARHSKVAMRCHPNLLVPRPAPALRLLKPLEAAEAEKFRSEAEAFAFLGLNFIRVIAFLAFGQARNKSYQLEDKELEVSHLQEHTPPMCPTKLAM